MDVLEKSSGPVVDSLVSRNKIGSFKKSWLVLQLTPEFGRIFVGTKTMKLRLVPVALLLFASSSSFGATALPGFCDVETSGAGVLQVRPGPGEEPITDINWFARPVPNPDNDWIIGYAMHNQNYLYNLSNGQRIRIPDKSDAVATPDGRYMTVPSYYTPNGYVRFYDNEVLLSHLKNGEDADSVEPVFIHEHEGVKQVFYQSLGHVRSDLSEAGKLDVYRMIFSGTLNESGFRMVDYTFTEVGDRISAEASAPIKLCPEINNDLMTPFISKDGQYIASYTSPIAEARHTAGASLKIYQITDVDFEAGAASCKEVVDLGFAAGKADFSFDGDSLTFHISNVNYLTVFINGGAPALDSGERGVLSTDVAVAKLTRDDSGVLSGVSGIARITTSEAIGTGRYFPAYLPDGNLYYISHTQTEKEENRRFQIEVVDPEQEFLKTNLFTDSLRTEQARAIGQLWSDACRVAENYRFQPHELPWLLFSLSGEQCSELVKASDSDQKPELLGVCESMAQN